MSIHFTATPALVKFGRHAMSMALHLRRSCLPEALQEVVLKAGVVMAVGILGAIWAGCALPPVPQGLCASPPAPVDAGPVAPRAGQANVEMLLESLYIRQRIKQMIERPTNDPAGAIVTGTTLVQQGSTGGGSSRPTIQIVLQPWLRGANGQPAPLSRYFRLTLALVPHVINATTVPDLNERNRLICPAGVNCPSEGLILTFDYLDLYDVSFGRDACTSPDIVSAQVIPAIFTQVRSQSPLLLPADQISTFLSSMTTTPARLVDANVGADGFLKLGLQYSSAATHSFVPADPISHFGGDWSLLINKAILDPIFLATVQSRASSIAFGATVTSLTTTFSTQPNEISLRGMMTLPVPGICGSSAIVSIAGNLPVRVCRDQSGKAALVGVFDTLSNDYNSSNVCVGVFKMFSTINVGTAGRLPTDPWDPIAQLSFDAGNGETLYATAIETFSSGWAIAGRSTVMDALGSRPPAPAACPGVH